MFFNEGNLHFNFKNKFFYPSTNFGFFDFFKESLLLNSIFKLFNHD